MHQLWTRGFIGDPASSHSSALEELEKYYFEHLNQYLLCTLQDYGVWQRRVEWGGAAWRVARACDKSVWQERVARACGEGVWRVARHRTLHARCGLRSHTCQHPVRLPLPPRRAALCGGEGREGGGCSGGGLGYWDWGRVQIHRSRCREGVEGGGWRHTPF